MSLPKHLAIIMDGNGRWAKVRGKPRTYGHVKGTRVAKQIITECSRLGIQWLTLYAFSTENWYRPQGEVSLLMRILKRYLRKETENLLKENIRVTVVGETSRLPKDVREALEKTIQATSRCTGLNLVFALSYGSRQEIASAVRALAAEVAAGNLPAEKIDEALLSEKLWTHPAPDPDLIIRTSGESRLSNFLLWQAAYSEFWFTDVLWPDFNQKNLHDALGSYQQRQRRFGRVETSNEKLPDQTH
ncbi:MAG: isoprenyl transferase [Bdellovibrionaceae bacterium]|nr:isoprenyl transferase [Pseudobdellovibrionaceae bacterium]MBX3033737.1 isoprenyl transferase [Pseudobdellovibrionaceae bacterium]